mmetsp:Transcript_2636/g.7554  ORF Transcript_2636/g.7554 Transcript_2636/m.7554 type:complete len:254 (+) Transcript_2636:871-1632(+)
MAARELWERIAHRCQVLLVLVRDVRPALSAAQRGELEWRSREEALGWCLAVVLGRSRCSSQQGANGGRAGVPPVAHRALLPAIVRLHPCLRSPTLRACQVSTDLRHTAPVPVASVVHHLHAVTHGPGRGERSGPLDGFGGESARATRALRGGLCWRERGRPELSLTPPRLLRKVRAVLKGARLLSSAPRVEVHDARAERRRGGAAAAAALRVGPREPAACGRSRVHRPHKAGLDARLRHADSLEVLRLVVRTT